ncbi:MAG: hypothetical protein GY729_01730 [Desulfobacteraceae bacterium]|nr:hypothetical protein [Desulfobacteraceae bacterium]
MRKKICLICILSAMFFAVPVCYAQNDTDCENVIECPEEMTSLINQERNRLLQELTVSFETNVTPPDFESIEQCLSVIDSFSSPEILITIPSFGGLINGLLAQGCEIISNAVEDAVDEVNSTISEEVSGFGVDGSFNFGSNDPGVHMNVKDSGSSVRNNLFKKMK